LKLRFDYTDLERKFLLPIRITDLVHKVEVEEEIRLGEIFVIFVTREKILKINSTYLKHNYFTDVITFNNSVKRNVCGDLFICAEEVLENAKRYGTRKEEELVRVIIHGILHLIGFDDKSCDDSIIMRSREDYYLELSRKMNLITDYEFKL
jgi:probable rRNA maturation factor